MSSLTKYSDKQQANFAKNSDPSQGISLCIPRVFNNIGWRRIKQHMIEAKLGFVERVDVIPVSGGAYKRAFVHFAAGKWNMRDETARTMLTALQEGRKIKLEYEEPWYWLVGISGAERPAEAPKPGVRRMRIQLVDMIEPTKTEYALDAQQDKEVKYGADPILARAVAGNPSGQIMEKGVEAVEHDLFADIPQNYA
mgnify:CR=1 FL=1